MNDYLNAVMELPFFRGFNPENIAGLLKKNTLCIRSYEKGKVIHLQNEKCHIMEIVLEGEVAVQKIEVDGKVLVINSFRSRDVYGANLLFSSRCFYPMTVIASRKTVVLEINREAVWSLCLQNENFMGEFLRTISDRTLILSNKIHEISLKTIREQIIEFLFYEKQLQQSDNIRMPFSKKNLAERLGIQRTSLSRELCKMREEGILTFDAHYIRLLKVDTYWRCSYGTCD